MLHPNSLETTHGRITIACNGAGLASFHKWNINRPGRSAVLVESVR